MDLNENEVLVLNAGHRERQALLAFWSKKVDEGMSNIQMPFWRYLEVVKYDARNDDFVLPDGERVTVQACNQLRQFGSR